MKRGFVTNELLIVLALFVVLFAISVPISKLIGWGKLGAFPISLCGFVLVFYILNFREITDQFRNHSKPDREKTDMEHPTINWLEPWWSTEKQDRKFHSQFKRELESEVCSHHPLHGIETRLIARGNGDDALFELLDGSGRYAVVHLTWARHPEPLPWPATELYNSLESFVNDRMIPEHEQIET